MEVKIELEVYGSNLGTRLLGRKIILDFEEKTNSCESVILDFHGVRFMSFSFASEMIDYFEKINKNVTFLNESINIRNQLNFAVKSKIKLDVNLPSLA